MNSVGAMLVGFLVLQPSGPQSGGEEIGAREFIAMMRELHADVRDFSLGFEGRMSAGPGRLELGAVDLKDPRARGDYYQGGYAYREDGATWLDVFTTRYGSMHEPDTIFEGRYSSAILDYEQSTVVRAPEDRDEKPSSRVGGPGTMNISECPERIIYYWHFKSWRDPGERNYKFLGWEDVDGHRCLKVEFDMILGLPPELPERPLQRMWIDLERGGHPLRVEYLQGKNLSMRAHGIKLAKIDTLDGKQVWFPVMGQMDNYVTVTGFSESSGGTELYYILDGTVRINEGLEDSVFTVTEDEAMPSPGPLGQLRQGFRKPTLRYDPRGITARLDEKLARVDAQLDRVVAEREWQGPVLWSLALRWTGLVVGMAMLAVAFFLLRRGRA